MSMEERPQKKPASDSRNLGPDEHQNAEDLTCSQERTSAAHRLADFDSEGTLAQVADGVRGYSEDHEGLRVEHISEEECAFLYQEIFVRESYMQHGITLREGAGDVIDVGANIGLFSLYVRRFLDSTATNLVDDTTRPSRIFAFEPIPRIFEVLQRNLKDVPEAYARPVALGAASSTSERFAYFDDAPGESSRHVGEALRQRARMRGHGDGGGREEAAGQRSGEQNSTARREGGSAGGACGKRREREGEEQGAGSEEAGEWEECWAEVRTLAEVLREEGVGRVQLLKVDAEGDELQVLMGLQQADWDKVHQVSLEVHDEAFRLSRTEALLRRQGFRVFVEKQQSQWEDDFLLLVPRDLKLFYVYAMR